MANFGNCINWVLQLEDRGLRGVTKNLGDGAGLTRFGVTSKNHPEVPIGFFSEPAAEALETAKNVYHASYWLQIHGDAFHADELAATLLSFAVNEGTHRAVEIFQGVLGLPQDGVFGSGTLMAVLTISDESGVAERLREANEAFYRRLGSPYLDGLINRARARYPDLP